MKLYRIEPDPDFRGRHSLNLDREWNLPGVKCDACGATWGTIGLIYPGRSLPARLNPRDYGSRYPVDAGRFWGLASALQQAWGSKLLVGPGLEFGRSIGTARGRMGSFAWRNSWCPFIENRSIELLRDAGVRFEMTEPRIKTPKDAFDYMELSIESFIELRGVTWVSAQAARCSQCGRAQLPDPEEEEGVTVVPESVPEDRDVFRLRDWTTYIIVSERFADAINRLKLTDVQLIPFLHSP